MALTKEEAEKKVSVGAVFLDVHDPGWAHRIDVGTLAMEDVCHCIVGQLKGNFDRGCRMLGLDHPETYDLGVALADADCDTWNIEASWLPIKDAWIAAIADRVVPQVEEVRHVGQGRESLPALSELSPVLAHPAVREGR